MKNIYPLLIFISGAFVTLLFTGNDNQEAKTNEYSKNSNHDAQLLKIQNQQEAVLVTLHNINKRLDNIETREENNAASEDSANIEIAPDTKERFKSTEKKNSTNLSDEEIQQTKYQIFDSLLSATMTVPEVMNSTELNALPETAKFKLIEEIVRRYNSGELPR